MKKIVVPGKRISGAVSFDSLLFTAGITGGSGDTETQIKNSFKRLKEILSKSDTSFENVIKATVYFSELSDREKYFNKIWEEMFPTNPPARTCVQVGLSGETKFEIELIAFIPK